MSIFDRSINLIRSVFKNVTVELHIFLFFLGYALHTAASFPLFYSKVCSSMFDEQDDSICLQLASRPDLEDRVQLRASEWMAFIELARFLPTILGTMFFGSYGDHYSTKLPVLVSLALMVVYMCSYMVLVSFRECPLWSLIIVSTVLAVAGQWASFVNGLYSLLAKKVRDESRLTFRYAVLTAFWSAAYVVSGNVAPFLYSVLSYQYVMLIGQAIVVLSFTMALWFYPSEEDPAAAAATVALLEPSPSDEPIVDVTVDQPQIQNDALPISSRPPSINAELPPTMTSSDPHSPTAILVSHESSEEGPTTTAPTRSTLSNLCLANALLYRSAWRTITKSRPDFGRAFLIVLCLVGIVYTSEDSGLDAVTSLFAYKAPLSWTPSILATWSAAMSLVQMSGSLISAYVFQRLRIANQWILLVGMGSGALKMLMMSVSTHSWMMFAALGLGCLSTVGFSALRACVVQLGDEEETGELMGCLTAITSFMPVFSVLVFNSVYSATLVKFSGATFAVCGGLIVLCMIAVGLMHFYRVRARKL